MKKETMRQYTRRILGYQQGKKPLAVISSTPGIIRRLLGKSPARALLQAQSRGAWSAADILSHLADSEMVFAFRLRLILGDSGTRIQAYDQNSWVAISRLTGRNPAEALGVFSVLRAANVRLLKSIPGKMWKYYGMHEERGKESVLRVVQMFAGHDINHLNQLRKLAARR